jgi:hypothetical protein
MYCNFLKKIKELGKTRGEEKKHIDIYITILYNKKWKKQYIF